MLHRFIVAVIVVLVLIHPGLLQAEARRGYYRFPALHGDTIVFTAEGDLWKVSVAGGTAQRLTSHLGQETHAAFSPDGETLAFSADYEGFTEVYTMPVAGGLPRRLTWEGAEARVVGWTPAGKILYATQHYSTLPDPQLVAIDPHRGLRDRLPLSQASEGVYDAAGDNLYFTRFRFQGSYTKRYRGGTAQNLWRFATGATEAVPLTADYAGTSREPMWWNGRLYFASDRDGTLNLCSIDPEGGDLRQHTHHVGWDVKSPDLSQGRIVYQLGADLHLLDPAADEDRKLAIALASDFDQMREKWITEPMEYLTAAHLAPAGDRVVLTARGQVFVAPVGKGRLVEVSRRDGVRYRSARFLPDGKGLAVLSDESGEVELWRLDARGVAAPEPLSDGGQVLRFDPLPSPDGRRIAYTDKNHELRIFDLETRRDTLAATSDFFGFQERAWSPDGRWLAYVVPAENFFLVIRLYRVADGTTVELTSDRFDSHSPAWSPDGRWIYLLSNRHLVSIVGEPWGNYQPGPFLDRTTRIYHVALRRDLRSPFAAVNELFPGKEEKKPSASDSESVEVLIDVEGIRERIQEVGVEPGNYTSLAVNAGHLFWLSAETSAERRQTLEAVAIGRETLVPKKLVPDALYYELSADGEKLLVRQGNRLFVRPAAAEEIPDLSEHEVALASWSFRLDPREEWRQMFVDAWRLERDFFYDRNMHGVDWPAMLEKYLPLVERVTERAELSDLFGELIGELSALHHYVRRGDLRAGPDEIPPASLGAVLERDEAAGGYRVRRIYGGEPDLPEERSPLARPGVEVVEGDVLVAINGVDTLSVADPGVLLRNQAGRQLLLQVREASSGELREAIIGPISPAEERELRYDTWEYERRRRVEQWGRGEIGYVHLRAMRGRDYTEWARNYFPVANRQGLIVDVRHNRGGNIDSWILGTLIRKPWMWWVPRVGAPYPNMQWAFRGHLVVLCDELTMSDGEAFAEGFRRLGLGPVIGTRTWGGEIWLTWMNELVDGGIATAAEFGVYGPEGEWLIEGHGVEPDVVVDNLPHATFLGEDAQLEAAVDYLLERLAEEPREVPPVPAYPDKSYRKPTGTPEAGDPGAP